MPDFAHIANSFATDPVASLLLAMPLSFALIIPSARIWWIHGPLAALFLTASLFLSNQRNLAFDSYLVALFAFPAICRDIPNQPMLYRIGIFWFSAFALLAAAIYAASERPRPSSPIETIVADRRPSAATIREDHLT